MTASHVTTSVSLKRRYLSSVSLRSVLSRLNSSPDPATGFQLAIPEELLRGACFRTCKEKRICGLLGCKEKKL